MGYAVQWLRSLVFVGQMYAMMPILALFFTPLAVFNRVWAFHGVHTYCRWVRWTASWMVGLRSEVRGTPPTDEVMVAAKHQSFFDILIIVSVLLRPKFIMKRELLRAPILGRYALWIGCVPVDRGKRGQAIEKMLADVKSGMQNPGQLIIYPQGTRVPPSETRPYKIGTGALYAQLGQTCIPAATNVGVFWPKRGIFRRPGNAVVEFLDPIAPGLPIPDFMERLEDTVESHSRSLMVEAGFTIEEEECG